MVVIIASSFLPVFARSSDNNINYNNNSSKTFLQYTHSTTQATKLNDQWTHRDQVQGWRRSCHHNNNKGWAKIYTYINNLSYIMTFIAFLVTTRTVSGSAAAKNISPLAKFKQLDKAAAQQQAQK